MINSPSIYTDTELSLYSLRGSTMTQEPQKPLDSTFLGFIILHWGNLLWSVIAALALIVLILGIRDLSLGNSGSQIAMDYIIFIIISIPRIWFAYPNGLLRG